MHYDRTSRRMFLRGAGGLLLALPFLESLTPRTARADFAPPIRFVQIILYGGRHIVPWYGSLSDGALTQFDASTYYRDLTTVQGPLSDNFGPAWDALRGKISILRGLDSMSTNETHPTGLASTASVDASNAQAIYPLSADMAIAKSSVTYPGGVPAGGTRFLNLEPQPSHVECDATCFFSSMFYSFDGGPVQPYFDTVGLFNEAFKTGVGGGATQEDPSVAKKRKLIDRAKAGIDALRASNRISSADLKSLEAYTSLLSDLQSSYRSGGVKNVVPPQPDESEMGYDARFKRMVGIALAALANGNTKVASIVLSYNQNPNIGGSEWHDKYLHAATFDAPNVDVFNASVTKNMEYVASILQQMDAIPDVNGSLLDNSIVFITNEHSAHGAHNQADMPVVIAGGGAGKLRTGYLIDYRQRDGSGALPPGTPYNNGTDVLYNGRPYNDVFTTMFKALGLPAADFQQPGNNQGGFGDYSKPYADVYGKYTNGVSLAEVTLPFLYKG